MKRLYDIWDELAYGIRWLCLRPSPVSRLIVIPAFFALLGAINIYITFCGISSIFSGNTQKKPMKIEHIKRLEIPRNDSIKQFKNQMYEYEQSGK